jgi:hypothetical protein
MGESVPARMAELGPIDHDDDEVLPLVPPFRNDDVSAANRLPKVVFSLGGDTLMDVDTASCTVGRRGPRIVLSSTLRGRRFSCSGGY